MGGRVVLTIPPGTQQGQTFRLAGQGCRASRAIPGDLYAKVKVVLPASWRASSVRLPRSSSGRSFNPIPQDLMRASLAEARREPARAARPTEGSQ